MIKQGWKGLMAVALVSLLCATMMPAPLAAASTGLGTRIEQDTNQGDDGQDDQNNDDQNNSQGQNSSDQSNAQGQNQQGQNQQGQNQGQGNQGQPQGNNQGTCFAGSDQASANFPTGCWVSLEAGGRDWYQFRYQGLSATRTDEDSEDSSDSNPPTVDARLRMDTPGCISFWVQTQERLQNPDPDGDDVDEPVGAGTPVVTQDNNNSDDNSDDNGDNNSDDNSNDNSNNNNSDNNNRDESVLGWQGSANANITFYIIVRNNRDFSCSYNLSLEGAGVPVAGQQGQQNQQGNQSSDNNTTSNNGNNSGTDDNGTNNNDADDNSTDDNGTNDNSTDDNGTDDNGTDGGRG